MKQFLEALIAATALTSVIPTNALTHGAGHLLLLDSMISLTGKYATTGEHVKQGRYRTPIAN